MRSLKAARCLKPPWSSICRDVIPNKGLQDHSSWINRRHPAETPPKGNKTWSKQFHNVPLEITATTAKRGGVGASPWLSDLAVLQVWVDVLNEGVIGVADGEDQLTQGAAPHVTLLCLHPQLEIKTTPWAFIQRQTVNGQTYAYGSWEDMRLPI